MNPAKADIRSNDRRCIRCRQVFCRIDVNSRRNPPFKVQVGART
jgi:hypothetical protein